MAGTNNSWNNQIAGSYNQIILNAGTNGVAISTDASAATVSIATGAAVKTTTLGSTNTTSSTVISSGSGNIIHNTGLTVDSTGRMTNTKQPCFLYYLASSTSNNIMGDSTLYTLGTAALTSAFDNGSNMTTGGTFTAPVTGRYSFSMGASFLNVTTQTNTQLRIAATSRTFLSPQTSGTGVSAAGTLGQNLTAIVDMTAADTCTFQSFCANTVKTVGLQGSASIMYTYASGFLIC